MMAVTVEEFMDQIHAEDFERETCELILKQTISYQNVFINSDGAPLSEEEQDIFDRAVLMMATSFYLNRDGSTKGVSKSYGGTNYLIDTIRNPSFEVT